MSIRSDKWIIDQCKTNKMIVPYEDQLIRHDDDNNKIISYGVSSYGYDVRLSDQFKLFTNVNSNIIDPLNINEKSFIDMVGDYCIIPPNSYLLGHTIEYFKIPRNVILLCIGKSTYARCGALINITPIEPEFEGQVVIEIANGTNCPLKVYANQGIAQFIFFEADESCMVSYADRNGKYQGQTGIRLASG